MRDLILWIITCLFSTFGVAYMYYKFTDAKTKLNVHIIITFLVGSIAMGLIKYYELNVLGALLYFIYFPYFFNLVNKLELKKIIYYLITIWIVGMLLDFISMFLVAIVYFCFHFNFDKIIMYISLILTLIVCFLMVAISHSNKLKELLLKGYQLFKKIKYYNLMIALFALGVLVIAFLLLYNLKHLSVALLLAVVSVLTAILFILIIKIKINYEENVKFLKYLKENNEFYIKNQDEYRIFRHNLVAKLLSIKSVSNKKSMALIDDVITQFQNTNKYEKNMKVIPYGLDGIIQQKLSPYLDKISVKVMNEIDYDIFTYLKPKRYNRLVEKLVVVLDNAIEAMMKSKEKVLVINIYDEGNNLCIQIENSFQDSIDIENLGTKSYSTKGLRRGLGLFSIIKSDDVKLKMEIINDYFVNKICVKKTNLRDDE